MTVGSAVLANRQSTEDLSGEHSTELHGRRLLIVRSAWLLAILLFASLYVANAQRITTGIRSDWMVTITRPLFADRDSFTTFMTYLLTLRWIIIGVFIITALFIAWRRSNDWLVLFVSFALFSTPMMLVLSLDLSNLRYPRLLEFIPAIDFLIGAVVSVSLFSSFLLLFYLFPDGRFYPKWTLWGFLSMVPMFVLFGVFELPGFQLPSWLQGDWVWGLFLTVFLFSVAIGLFSQQARYRHIASPLQRQQTRLVLFALAFQLVPLLSSAVLTSEGRPVGALINLHLSALVPVLIPIAIAVSILRYRLWDAGLILNRALVYGALTAVLALLYVASIVLLQTLFRQLTGETQPQLVTVLSTLLIAAVFMPMRSRLQSLIDRRFYRRKYDAARTLAEFNETIRDEVELEALTAELLHVISQTMQPTNVSLWLKPWLEPVANGRPLSKNARQSLNRAKGDQE